MLIDVELDEYISDELRNHARMLNHNKIPMWFIDDREKDKQAVNHLIHCMKVVSDYYSNFDEPKFFDYSSATQ